MTDLDHEFKRQNGTGELGRARQRKLKHEQKSAQPADLNASRQQTTRTRSSRRAGPSTREQTVSNQLKAPSVSVDSIQEKLSSTLDAISGNRTPRRKKENQRSGSLYEATIHAETQRLKPALKQATPQKSSRQFEARSASVPPVMVRGGMGGMAFGRNASSKSRKGKSPRRRIDVPLGVPGAEVRLPSIPLVHLGWRAVSMIMVLMMIGSLFLMWKAPVFQVKTIEAKGLQHLTVGDLNAVMGTFGKSVFSLNPSELKNSLQQSFPELSKISVRVNLPASVNVVVTERQPVISWRQDDREYWVDAEGISFTPRGTLDKPLVQVEGHGTLPGTNSATTPSDQVSLPPGITTTMTTPSPSLRLSPDLVNAILELGSKMPADTLLVYDSEHGLGWNDPGGWDVFFGSEDEDMPMKLAVYQALVDKLQNEGIQPAMISVEYVHAPYYRTER